MKNILILMIIIITVSCTKQTVIDTGVSNPFFEGTMMDYLRSDEMNWKRTVEMIEHAELNDLFEGRDPDYPEITFFGIKSFSIERFLIQSQLGWGPYYYKVSDMPKDMCRNYILNHVVKGKYLKNDVEYRNKQYAIENENQTGGTDLTTLTGIVLRVYRDKSDYAGVPDAGPETLKVYSISGKTKLPMATPDIQPINGVVHALTADYHLGTI